jgi:hypothetical protein
MKKISIFIFIYVLILFSVLLGTFILDNYPAFNRYFYYLKFLPLLLFVFLIDLILIKNKLINSLFLLFFFVFFYFNSLNFIEIASKNFNSKKKESRNNFFTEVDSKIRSFYIKMPQKTWDTRSAVLTNILNPNIFVYDLCITGYCKNTFGIEKLNSTKKIEEYLEKNELMEIGKPTQKDFIKFYEKSRTDYVYQSLFSNFFYEYSEKYDVEYLISKFDLSKDPLFTKINIKPFLISKIGKSKKNIQIYYMYKIEKKIN